jgi:hypothetical protein
LLFPRASGADGEFFSAWFPISSKRIGGEPENFKRGVYTTPLFLYNIYWE